MDEEILNEHPPSVTVGPSRLKSAVLGLVLLVCGVAIGSVTTAVMFNRGPWRELGKFGHAPDEIANRMKEKYNLSDEQAKQLMTIFEEHGDKLAQIRAEVQPRVDAEHEALQSAVEKILTPEQAADWRADFEKMRNSWRQRRGDISNASKHRHKMGPDDRPPHNGKDGE
jgi:Spy/CpxP family protein refolding chaperone